MCMIGIGQECWIIENNMRIRPVTVTKISGGMYTLKFKNGGGVRLRKNRIFETEEDARAKIKKGDIFSSKTTNNKGPYNYLH